MNITIQRIRLKQILLSLCSLAVFWGLSINLNAQVTIGLTEKPIDGALLQLKDIEGVTGADANANKGLALPIVELTALNTLIISGADYNSEALAHIGLTVYNTKEDLTENLYKAPYMWDGAKWNPMYRKDWVEVPRSLYFYKSAWKPKKLPVTGFVDNIDRNVNIALHADANGTVDFTGVGAIFPTSPQLQVDGEEEYTFQPVENTGGEIRSTNVTFTASRSGSIGTANKTTRIVHYPYEFPIHIDPNILPATLINNGVDAASIWSAADWKISDPQPADHDPLSMLATSLNLGEELRDERPLKLNINQNSTWNEKEIKINVESVGADGKHYEDLAPQTLIVKQRANVPTIGIIDPANKILDFGLATGTKNVTIRSNAKWIATGASNIDNVIGSNAILGGTQHGVNSPAVPINTTIALPVSTTGGNAKAGTVYNSNITFTTTGHGTASAVSSTLAVKKTTPIRWDYPTITPMSNPLPRTGAYFTANVSTNTDWYRGADFAVNGGTQLKTTNGYISDSQSIPMLDNNSWEPRNINAGLWHASSAQTLITVQQLGYDLNVLGTNIVGEATIGSSRNTSYYAHLTTSGGAPVGHIGVSTVADASSWLWLDLRTAPHFSNVFLDIPANTGAVRALYFFYEKQGYKWEPVATMYQAAPVFDAKVTSSVGATATITVKSDISFRFCIGSLGTANVSGGGESGDIIAESSRIFSPSAITTYTFTIRRDGGYPYEYVYIRSKVIPLGGGVSTPVYSVTSYKNDGWLGEYREGSLPLCSY